MTQAERQYVLSQDPARLRALGQYFTDPRIGEFMVRFACPGAKALLDPALGSGRFPRLAREIAPGCAVTAYEIDPEVLRAFPPEGLTLRQTDYLRGPWEERFDAVVCNPPYRRFQHIPDRELLRSMVEDRSGISFSGFANLYALFLGKSICQMAPEGRLAYVIPTEFLHAGYAQGLRARILRDRLLRAVVRIREDRGLFPGAVTTCCLLLLDRQPKQSAAFVSLSSPEALAGRCLRELPQRTVSLDTLSPVESWLPFFGDFSLADYQNLVPTARFFRAGRGIATGANEYFCLTPSRLREFSVPRSCVVPCLCRSRDAMGPLFTDRDLADLIARDRPVFLLDPPDDSSAGSYLARGEALGIPQKYLPAHRDPWYAPEPQIPAPIWIAGACRGGMKVVRNLAGVRALSTFHLIRPAPGTDPDLLFAYLRSPVAQTLLLRQGRTMGQGLTKFQPGDLNRGKMLDLNLLTPEDRQRALALGREPGSEDALDRLFRPYLEF